MLNFTTNRKEFENELIDEIKLFFPYLDDCNLCIVHECEIIPKEDGKEYINTIKINEKTQSYVDFLNNDLTDLVRKRLDKRASKLALFKALLDVLKTAPPWGSLTGIRPSKLVYDMLDEGLGIDECEDEMQKQFFVSKQKSKLICDIVKNQKGFYTKEQSKINLYVHIPFCTSKCSYCSFTTEVLSRGKKFIPEYIKLLRQEITSAVETIHKYGRLCSVYVGGGTPTALEANELYELFNGFDEFREVEFTVEAGRPDTITEEKLQVLKNLGVNRICVNPQSLNDKTLREIGRAHTADDFFEKYALTKKFWFNINVDTIAGLSKETVEDFKNTIDKIVALEPENITVHTLSRKNGSALTLSGRHENSSVSDMTDYAFATLSKSGYIPYYLYRQKQMLGNLENIGYSLKGKQCLNNITTMEDCISVVACGAGAISKIVSTREKRIERFANVRDVALYLKTFEEKMKDKENFYQKQFTKAL